MIDITAYGGRIVVGLCAAVVTTAVSVTSETRDKRTEYELVE